MTSEIALRIEYPDIWGYIRYFASILYSKVKGMTSAGTACEKKSEQAGISVADAGRILDKYGNILLRVAYSYLHNMADAEDILQDTLISFLKNSPSFENDAHEKAWLITVASNLSKNKINYNKLRNTDELSEEFVSQEKEDLQFVWEAVKQLPESNREVIHLFYQEGYSTGEIAEILGRKESTVRSDLKRGRERLKKILKEAYDFE